MSTCLDVDKFRRVLSSFRPERYALTRCLALYSAAIAVADEELLSLAVSRSQPFGVERNQLYEIVLQSYLFLGFPRMLSAATHLARMLPGGEGAGEDHAPTEAEPSTWHERGLALCRQIYGDAFEPLRTQVIPVSPEIFDWMIMEGYGKVLSRPGLDIIDRELSIVAFLMVENRPMQLFSHMRGALNVGATEVLLRFVIEDIGDSVGEGYREAHAVLERLGVT